MGWLRYLIKTYINQSIKIDEWSNLSDKWMPAWIEFWVIAMYF